MLALVAFGTGWYSVAASRPSDALDSWAAWVKRQSVPEHAVPRTVPPPDDAEAVAAGLEHYSTNCLPCHGAPGVEGMEFHEGMRPEPPHIDEQQVQRWSDRELFWIVKHGIRMTGMPAFGSSHSDEEIARIVAFVRHAPHLTAAERQKLAQALPGEHHHGGEASHGQASEHHESGEAAERGTPRR